MVTNKNATGNLAKTKILIKVLKKCNGKAVVGNSEALISPKVARILAYCGLLILAVGLFVGSYIAQPYISQFIEVERITQVIMMGILVLSFILAVKNIITTLYANDDLELLLPMPFSANQIVMAKLAVASVFPVVLSVMALNPICLGLGIHAGLGITYIIGIIISSLLLPITGIAMATLIVVIVFRIFGVLRNRDMTVALGGIFSFGIMIVYIFRKKIFGSGSDTFNAISNISTVIPIITFMNKFMYEGNMLGLLISLIITIGILGLSTLAIKAFYFKTALSMQNTSAKNNDVSKSLRHKGKKKNVLKALTGYEAKSTKRNPAYIIYGFVMSFVWPVILILPFILDNNRLNNINLPFSDIGVMIGFMAFALTASCCSCGYNVLPGTAFSREGNNFSFIRSLPVDYTDYYKSKRNFSLLICSLGSVLYVIVLGIVAIALGAITIENSWIILASACFSFLINLICINLLLLRNSKKPNFNWDSETEISRKLGIINVILIVLGIISLIICIANITITMNLDTSQLMPTASIICLGVLLITLVLAISINKYAIKTSVKNLMKIE